MNREIETALVKACIDYRSNKTTSLGHSEQLSNTEKYVSSAVFDTERDKVFKTQPCAVLHSSELTETNSYQSVDTPLGSLIITRDAESRVHAFRNMCRHRGTKLVDGNGCSKLLVCPYHAWSYATDGNLISIPGQAHCFPTLNKDDHGLLSIPCVEKHGFIWVCPSSDEATIDNHLSEYLGEMAEHLEWMESTELKVYQRTKKHWKANWKLFAEGGLETYHFAYAHKDTIARSFQNNISVIDQIGSHFRVVMPTRAINKTDLLDAPYLSLREFSHTLFFLTPSAAFLVQEEHVDWIRFLPLSADKTEIIVTSLIPKKVDLSDKAVEAHWAKNHHITNVTLDEDWALGEGIQSAIQSGGMPHIVYGKNEWALHALNMQIQRLIDQ